MPIFTELANAEQHYVQISYTTFDTDRTINMETQLNRSLTPLSTVLLSLT